MGRSIRSSGAAASRDARTQVRKIMQTDDAPTILLGGFADPPDPCPAAEILYDDARLRRCANAPWGRAWAARQLGSSWPSSAIRSTGDAAVTLSEVARHAMVVGPTGTGKTCSLGHLSTRLWEAGHSAVVMEGKGDLCDLALELARAQGIRPEQVVIIDPRLPEAPPSLNPFDAGQRPELASRDFRSTLEGCFAGFFGPRSRTFLLHACAVIAAHRLSVHELHRFVVRPDYREALLRQPFPLDSALMLGEAAEYYRREVAHWSRSLLAEAIQPVANKLPEFQQPFLWSLFCGGRGFDLGRLWREQFLVVVRLDRAELGEEAVRLVAAILVQMLFRTALRRPGPRPVALFLDELGTTERLVGHALTDIVTQGRSLGLHCVAAFQHAEQLTPELLATLSANCAVQCFFRQGPDGARRLAAGLAAGAEERLLRVRAAVAAEDAMGRPETAAWRHPVRDGFGRPLRISPPAWADFRRASLRSGDPLGELAGLAASAGIRRLYVHRADDGRPVGLREYAGGLRPGADFYVDGPAPLEFVVTFPRMKLSGPERLTEADAARVWIRRLQELPVQHCALRVGGIPRGVVRMADLRRPPPDEKAGQAYREACSRAHGRSLAELARMHRHREAEVERLATGGFGSTTDGTPVRPDESRTREARSGTEQRNSENGHRIAPDGSLD